MAHDRLELRDLLRSLLGSSNTYFQEPPSVGIDYPCIIYKVDDINTTHANNKPYDRRKRYQITVIDRDPDSVIHDKVGELPTASFDRFFIADGLNHHVYNLYW